MKILDANEIDATTRIDTDLCIVGAGPAGLSVAVELAGSPFRVCLLESGALSPRDEDQRHNAFENIGHALNTDDPVRTRAFGGASHLWFGRCGAMDPLDFEPRDWIPCSGWPIAPQEVSDCIPRAAEILGLQNPESVWRRFWERDVTFAGLGSGALSPGVHVWTRDLLTGARALRTLRASRNVQIVLRATCRELVGKPSDSQVEEIRVRGSRGNAFSVRARAFVLAAGGLENARLMLLSRAGNPSGFANTRDVLGRYYINHPRNEGLARLHLDPTHPQYRRIRDRLDMGYAREIGAEMQFFFSPSESHQRRERLLNACSFVYAKLPGEMAPLADSARTLRIALRTRRPSRAAARAGLNLASHFPTLMAVAAQRIAGHPQKVDHFVVVDHVEQAPDPASRVTLGEKRDAFGDPQLRLDWRISPESTRSLRALHMAISERFTKSGIGRLESPLLTDSECEPDYTDASHPAGTTRMCDDPNRGVVDRDARVHGVRNLYLAGSSIFPTLGHAPPTLTIAALGVRLARHIRSGFAGSRFSGAE